VIGTISKNTLEEIRVSLDEFRGVALLDVRIFADFTGADHDNKRPTKKGISLKIAKLPELLQALREAEAEAIRRGLLRKEGAMPDG
jgi:hypothetical protein